MPRPTAALRLAAIAATAAIASVVQADGLLPAEGPSSILTPAPPGLLPPIAESAPEPAVICSFRLPLEDTQYLFDVVMAPVYDVDLTGVDSIAKTLPYLLESPFFLQSGRKNPLVVALEQTRRYNSSDGEFPRRLAEAAFYAWQNRRTPYAAADATQTLLKDEKVVLRDAVINLAASAVARQFRGFVGRAETEGDQIALDIAIYTITSFDSVMSVENLILAANRRNIGAIIVCDHDRIDGVRRAQIVAERLKREGRIRPDFVVVPGQDITSVEGHILGLFLTEMVLPGMTARQTLRDIHRQGGLAVLADPASDNGVKFAATLPFDGFVIRPGIRRLFRTLQLQRDPKAFSKPFFYTPQTHFKDLIEGVYVVVDTPDHTPDGLRRAIREGNVWASGNAYFPIIAVLGFRPITKYETLLNKYFTTRESVERFVERLTGSDNVTLRISWSVEFARLMDFDITGVVKPAAGVESSLTRFPRVLAVSASWGPVVVRYGRDPEYVSIGAVFAFW
jgi:hypothetical protein